MASDNDGNYDTRKLPEDLLLEILLRLVVESLLRAKCVCKYWERIVLWNPALMDFKTIPLPPHHYLLHYEVAFGTVGFGKDPLTNDYKVVITRNFCNKLDNYNLDYNFVTAVYNLRTNTWRNLDLGELGNLRCDNNCSSSFLDGTYHWWASSGVVLAFDMGNETFRVIRGPDFSQFYRKDRLYLDLTVYEERVALTREDGTSVSIWVMLEEGFWIKQYSIGPFPGLMKQLGFSKKSGIFLVIDDTETESETEMPNCNAKMVLYDINTQEMKNVGPRAFAFGFRTCAYYESLLSISGRTSCKGKLDPWKRVADFFNKRSCS